MPYMEMIAVHHSHKKKKGKKEGRGLCTSVPDDSAPRARGCSYRELQDLGGMMSLEPPLRCPPTRMRSSAALRWYGGRGHPGDGSH